MHDLGSLLISKTQDIEKKKFYYTYYDRIGRDRMIGYKKIKIRLLNQFRYKNKNKKMIESNKIHLILEYMFLLFILEKYLC